ncbi:MAG: glycosyl transferase family 2 [Planctomycetaceae bacterium]|nr:glycosyl transferase family 2 [Planctomycetaceae bacterium]
MRITVIIPALNEESVIDQAIASAWEAGADEVIVVDGGSDDRTVAVAKEYNCKVVAAPKGRASQQNAGAREATGDVFLFLHADSRLGESACQQIRDALERPDVAGGALRQRIEANGLGYRILEQGNAWRVRWLGLPYGDQAIFVRREEFEELGGFPEVKLMEDLLLMKQLRRKAWPVLLPGLVFVDARRWQQHGIIRQTLRNWWLLAAHKLGKSPDQLATYYRRHDE